MELTPDQKILKAKHRMMRFFPFFSFLLSYLKTKEADWLPYKTMGTDGKHIFWHKDFIRSSSVEQVTFALMHEVLHVISEHFSRKEKRDVNLWSAATDYAVNGILEQQNSKYLELPLGGKIYLDKKYYGMSAEQIYAVLPKGPPVLVFDSHFEGEGSADESVRWRTRTHAAYTYAKNMRMVPAGLEEFVTQMTTPLVDWRTRLHRFVDQFSRDDYSWSRFNKMHIYRGIYLPGCYSQDIADAVLVVDSSASISDDQLSQFFAEIFVVKTTYPMRIHLIQCDSEVRSYEIFEKGQNIDKSGVKVIGRGSTDFRPPFNCLEEKGIKPSFMIYFTDGEGKFPSTPSAYPVLWALTEKHNSPPWGEALVINI